MFSTFNNHQNQNVCFSPTLAIHGSVTPARHRAAEPPIWTPRGQRDGCNCLRHLHRVEELDQHDVIIQSLVVITVETKFNF